MDSVESRVGSACEELWSGLPRSNVYKQRKLVGWSEGHDGRQGEGELERRVLFLEGERYGELRAFLDGREQSFNTVMLGIYHLVLQWYLDEFESLIGCCLIDGGKGDVTGDAGHSLTLRPSYVYAEDDDPIEGVLMEVGQQLRSGRSINVDPGGGAASWSTARAPIFYFAGIIGLCERGPNLKRFLETGLVEGRVVVSAATETERAGLGVSMPSAIAHAVDVDGFRRRYDEALGSLLAGRCSSVGELRSELGDALQIPYHQLYEMQRRVITLWAKVLDIDEESCEETSSYFELGGNSLNAFKLVNLVRLEFQREISLRDIIENPTVEEFVRVLLR